MYLEGRKPAGHYKYSQGLGVGWQRTSGAIPKAGLIGSHLVHVSCYYIHVLGIFFFNYEDESLPLKLLVVMPWLVLLIYN